MSNMAKAIMKDLKKMKKKEKTIYISKCMSCLHEWVYFRSRPYSKCHLCGYQMNYMEAK